MFERTYETQLIISYLQSCIDENREGVITYGEIGQKAGMDVNGSTVQLRTARKAIEADQKILFETVPTEGIVIVRGDKQAGVATEARIRLRRHAGRALKRMGNVRFNELSDEAKTQHNLNASIFGVSLALTKSSTVKKLERKVGNGTALPIAETMRLFIDEPDENLTRQDETGRDENLT